MNNWYFGNQAGITFNTTPPSTLAQGQLITDEGCSAMSDANGNLLFYTNGVTIWNANHSVMEQGLLGDSSSTSSGLIVPHPIDPNLFYVFTIDAAGTYSEGLHYSVVDMNLNNGLGDVLPNKKNVHLTNYPTGKSASEKLTATTGDGCAEYWVLSRSGNKFYAFKIDGNGVHPPIVSKVGPMVYDRKGTGYMKFSPDGTMVLATHTMGGILGVGVPRTVHLYDFDKTSGVVSNPTMLYDNLDPQFSLMLGMYGLEFSMGSTKVYATSNSDMKSVLYQWDLESENIAASLFKFPNVHAKGALQLAPNGKIYVPSGIDPGILYVINDPEEKGLEADYSEDPQNGAVLLSSGAAKTGLPQVTPSLLFPWIRINIIDDSDKIVTKLSHCAQNGDYVLSYDENLAGDVSYKWYKNDVLLSGETSNSLTISPLPSGTNLPAQVNYRLEVFQIEDGCLYQYRGVAKVTFHPRPTVFDVVFEQCQMQDTATSIYNLNLIRGEIVGNAPIENYSFEFYPSLTDAQNGNNQIVNPSVYYSNSNAEVLGVKITKNETGCFDFIELTLAVNQNGFNLPPVEIATCDTNGNGIHLFNLTDALPEITSGNDQLNVRFYETVEQAYTELDSIEDVLYYMNENSPYFQTVYARVENNDECAGIREVNLITVGTPPIGPDLIGENSLVYCLENLPENITLSSGVPENQLGNFSFLWEPTGETTPTIGTHEPGEYSVRVTDNQTGCYVYRAIDILPSNIASFDIEQTGDSDNRNLTVVLSEESIGDYVYALDNIEGPYQDSNIFEGVAPGFHTVYIKDKNGCGISIKEVGIIGTMKFFTPNNDGINDRWKLIAAPYEQQLQIEVYIYDRYGKLLHSSSARTAGWDGTYSGKRMPSNDYWYHIVLKDGRTLKGNFTLKR